MATKGVMEHVNEDPRFADGLRRCMDRHITGDWGDLPKEDREMNDYAIEMERRGKPSDRLMSAYTIRGVRVWIITEYDRSHTTVLLPEEY